jgi:hypothetical protein
MKERTEKADETVKKKRSQRKPSGNGIIDARMSYID